MPPKEQDPCGVQPPHNRYSLFRLLATQALSLVSYLETIIHLQGLAHALSELDYVSGFRRRTASYPTTPAQIRAHGFPAPGSSGSLASTSGLTKCGHPTAPTPQTPSAPRRHND